MILGGDLGGTKTLLALAEQDAAGRIRIVRQQRFASADYLAFETMLGEFLADAAPVDSACFGVAGPTDGHRATLTYLPWHLSAAELGRRFAIPRVTLANDFAAAAHGLPLLEPEHIITLLAGQPIEHAPRVILGAGTGLGVAGLIREALGYRVIAGEGGHIGFSPQTAQQGELWHWLLDRNGRVTSEDIVSGPGLERIHAFLGGRPRQASEIGQAALAGTDRLASATLDLWLACYGAFAGDLALHWLARGGVYLAGGMAAKLMSGADSRPFIHAFLAKREHSGLMKDVPVFLITAEDLGLRGALALAIA
ncbi:MAG TPA: glucokinase [Azonexus sp.]|jgi:glucokinase|nr:glucokinase [Azonexus sp.]